jgi:hypothetical protein
MCQWVGKKLYRKKKCQTLQLFMYQFLQEVAKSLIQKKTGFWKTAVKLPQPNPVKLAS